MRWNSPRIDILRGSLAAAALVLAAACSSDSGTGSKGVEVQPTASLQFLTPRSGAPPLVATSTSFWAKKGDNRELRLYYHKAIDEADSSEFLRFRVDAQSLDRRPDGTPIATGDSVLITVTVSDLTNLIIDFQPAGLHFAASRPARLTIKYAEADEDLNDDGEVNGEDSTLLNELAIWRRESATDPWEKQASVLNTTELELDTDVLGFTNYAIAYRKAQ